MKSLLKSLAHFHKQGERPSVMLFASPRGGSTWVTELIASQPGFWPISEPLNVRLQWVQDHLGVSSYAALYDEKNLPLLERYYGKLLCGAYRDLKLHPGLKFYRPLTHRIIVKENQGCLDRMGWFEDTFNVKVIHLIRHPIPVALSREVFPLLDEFPKCALRSHFSAEELDLADSIIESGSHLEKGILAWCLHHLPSLRSERDSWVRITYEETVLQPDKVIDRLVKELSLPDRQRIERQIVEPSQVTRKSNAETQQLLTHKANRESLVYKWSQSVNEHELQQVHYILNTFNVDIYSAFSPFPLEKTKINV